MRKLITPILILASLAFSIMADEILQIWKESEYVSFRFFVEESKYPKMRYEKVYKMGEDKVVFVLNPSEIVWVREDGKCWMGDEKLYVVPSGIKDLEDVAIEALEEATDATIVEADGWYILEYSGEKGSFDVEIDEAWIPIRIARRIDGVEMKMTFEPLLEDVPSFQDLLKGREMTDELAFPEDFGRVLTLFDWFATSREGDLMKIEGIIEGKWHEVLVGFEEFEGAVRFGKIYVRSDQEVLKLLEGGSD